MIKNLSAAALVIALAIAVPLGAAAKNHKKGGGDSGSGDDLFKAVAGLAAIAIIASEVKKGKKAKEAANAAAAAAAAADAKAKQGLQVCNDPYWDGVSWRNRDGRVCLPTPAVCLRETILANQALKRFDHECMWKEGFRLSSADR